MGARSGSGTGGGARFESYVKNQIKAGVSGSKIADTMVSKGVDRKSALMAISMIGAKMNMKANPGMSFKDAFKAYAGIK